MIKKNTKSKQQPVIDLHKLDFFEQIKTDILNDTVFLSKLKKGLDKEDSIRKNKSRINWIKYLEIHESIF